MQYWYGEVGREEGSGWGACDFFKINKKKKKNAVLETIPQEVHIVY